MDFLLAFFAGAIATLIAGAVARFLAGHFTVYSRPGSLAFCLALGYAIGKFGNGGPINRETMVALTTAGGSAIALVVLWWVLVRRNVEQSY